MRRIELIVPAAAAREVVEEAKRHDGFAPSITRVERDGGDGWREVTVTLSNDRVGAFIEAIAARVDDAEILLHPQGVLPLTTPIGDVRDRVTDVSRLSTMELVLDSLQSLGSWAGLLVYASISGIVAAYGVLFNIPWLLTAAMLIAPMGAPLMVAVVGAAIGDGWMLWRGTLRFLVALVLLAAIAALLGALYGIEVSSATMELISNLSMWTVVLAVAGGAAGAQSLVRAERDSLVTSTATGFLVAVALSPPSAVLGLAVALGRWDYVALMGFVLLLTFVGILAGGWVSLRWIGVRTDRASPSSGSRRIAFATVAIAALATVGLVAWQNRLQPRFVKSDLVRQAIVSTRDAVDRLPGYRLIDASAHFTRQDATWHPGEGLVVRALVGATDSTRIQAGGRVRETIEDAVHARLDDVRAFVVLDFVVVAE